MSAKLASDATFKSYITTAANIAVYDSVGGALRPRDVTLDLATDKLLINFDGATSTSADKRFLICVGSNINEANATTAYTNSGYAHRWGVDSATITNDVTGSTGTISGTVTTGETGVYSKAACITGTASSVSLGDLGFFNSRTQFTGEYLFKNNTDAQNGYLFSCYESTSNWFLIFNQSSALRIYMGGSTTYGAVSLALAPAGSWHHFVFMYNGAGATNADKLKFIVDGVERSITFNSTIPSSLTIATDYKFGYLNASKEHCFDEVGFTTDIKTAAFATTRYNQFFDAGFWSVGTGVEIARITVDPVNTACSLSHACTLFVAATGTEPLTYYWQSILGATITTIASSDNDSLIFTPTLSDSGKSYRCVVSNDFGADTSATARLDVPYSDEATYVIIYPSSVRIDTMATRQFTAIFYDVGGRVSTNHDAVVWSTSASGATEGAIDESTGLFTAGTDVGGPYTVTATAGALSDDATVLVAFPLNNKRSGWSWKWGGWTW